MGHFGSGGSALLDPPYGPFSLFIHLPHYLVNRWKIQKKLMWDGSPDKLVFLSYATNMKQKSGRARDLDNIQHLQLILEEQKDNHD